MKFVLLIHTGFSGFDENPSVEVAHILSDLSTNKHIANHPNFSPGMDQAVYDKDGNECGFFMVYPDSVRVEFHSAPRQ